MGESMRVPRRKEDPIYGLQVKIKNDRRKNLLNLSIGVLVDERGELYQFSAVKKAEKRVYEGGGAKEYLPIDGLSSFCSKIQELVLGKDAEAYTAQTVGGTAALHIAGQFIRQFCTKKIFIPEPTWVNHRGSLEAAGLVVATYPYPVSKTGTLHVGAIVKAIRGMPNGSAIVFQASCHNPTGIDPTEQEWRTLLQEAGQRKLTILFDLAYQGLGKSLEEDARAIALSHKAGLEFFIASSCSKNFGLYGERVGALTVVCKGKKRAAVSSQIRHIIRTNYSSPPRHGAEIVSTILNTPSLRKEWESELSTLRALLASLRRKSGFIHSRGLFCMTTLGRRRVEQIRQQEAIYLADDGRINIAALSEKNIPRIRKLAP